MFRNYVIINIQRVKQIETKQNTSSTTYNNISFTFIFILSATLCQHLTWSDRQVRDGITFQFIVE